MTPHNYQPIVSYVKDQVSPMIRVLLLNCDRLTSTAVVPLLSSAQDMALLAEIDELCHASKLPTLQPDVIVMGGGSA